MIPPLYDLSEAAQLLGVSAEWLRTRLYDHTFAGCKVAGRWRMTEEQITEAIEAMSTTAREMERPSPAGLSRGSRFRRRVRQAS
jgi:hypothetical protein